MRLVITTFWKSCPDARHYYGEIYDNNGKFLHGIGRKDSRKAVIQAARAWVSKSGEWQSTLRVERKINHR